MQVQYLEKKKSSLSKTRIVLDVVDCAAVSVCDLGLKSSLWFGMYLFCLSLNQEKNAVCINDQLGKNASIYDYKEGFEIFCI